MLLDPQQCWKHKANEGVVGVSCLYASSFQSFLLPSSIFPSLLLLPPSFLPCFIPCFLAFLPSVLPSLLSFLPSLPSLPSFLPSLFPSFLPSKGNWKKKLKKSRTKKNKKILPPISLPFLCRYSNVFEEWFSHAIIVHSPHLNVGFLFFLVSPRRLRLLSSPPPPPLLLHTGTYKQYTTPREIHRETNTNTTERPNTNRHKHRERHAQRDSCRETHRDSFADLVGCGRRSGFLEMFHIHMKSFCCFAFWGLSKLFPILW